MAGLWSLRPRSLCVGFWAGSRVIESYPRADYEPLSRKNAVNLNGPAVRADVLMCRFLRLRARYRKPTSSPSLCILNLSKTSKGSKLLAQSESNQVKRELKTRHLSMIALGGSIGTGLFVASGSAIATAGPGGAIAAYVGIGLMVFFPNDQSR